MIKKIDHLVITTSDVNRLIPFYQALGFLVYDRGNRHEFFAGDFKINVHYLKSELSPHASNVQPGSADLCFEIEGDINRYKAELLKKGLDILLGVVTRNGANGEMQSIYLRDPDGNLIEFCSYGNKD